MKIPLLQQEGIAPKTAQVMVPQGVAPTGLEAAQRAFEQVGRATDAALEQYQKAQHEASVEDARDKLNQLGDYSTDGLHGSSAENAGGGTQLRLGDPADFLGPVPVQAQANTQQPGFLSLRGEDAVASSAGFMGAWDKKRKDLGDSLTSDTAKRIFEQQSEQLRAGVHEKVESHVAQQVQVQKESTYLSSVDEAKRAVAADPANDAIAGQRIADVAGAAHGMFGGNEAEVQRRAVTAQAQVAAVRMDNLLAPGPQQNVAKAREVLEANRGVLGDQLDHYESLLGKTSDAVLAEQTASSIVHRSLRPDGTLNDRAAIDALDKVPPELADNVRPILYRRMTEAEQAAKADTARVSQKAFASFNVGGWAGIAPDLKTQLNQRNPELYNRLRTEDEMRFRRARSSGTEQRQMQAALNRDAMNDFKALPIEQQATIDLGPDGEFAQAHPGADVHGFKAIAPVQRAAGDSVAKGQAEPMNQFVADATANAEAWLQPGRTPSQKQARAAAMLDVKSKAVDAWNDWREAHGGKPPSAAEAKKLVGGIITKLTPTNDAEAKAAGAAIADQVNNAKPAKRDRALELKRQGKSNADIAKQLTQEGY